ncbi:hypothetical protein [Halalkalicoccus salilacus]|uniref:hypothetical protein n=1 Tax=Halalkalicoccus TaxID=332246 RepID=UPI002F96C226
MYALISLILIIALSMLVVRVGTVALVMTGLSREVASMQALSAYSGAGFTTEEAEETVAYPARRQVVKNLMRLGNVGLVTSMSSLVLSFTDPTARFERLVVLVAAALVLIGLARSTWFDRLLTPVIKGVLSRHSSFAIRDYTRLLNLKRDHAGRHAHRIRTGGPSPGARRPLGERRAGPRGRKGEVPSAARVRAQTRSETEVERDPYRRLR